jgi:hypothetical protein
VKRHIDIQIYRNFELTGLQACNIVYGGEGPAPYFHPYFTVHLENRKGWQRKLGHDGPLESKCQTDQVLWLLTIQVVVRQLLQHLSARNSGTRHVHLSAEVDYSPPKPPRSQTRT